MLRPRIGAFIITTVTRLLEELLFVEEMSFKVFFEQPLLSSAHELGSGKAAKLAIKMIGPIALCLLVRASQIHALLFEASEA